MSESVEVEQVPDAIDVDAAPQRVRRENMQRTPRDDVSACHFAQGVQPDGIHKANARAVDVDVLIRAEPVELGTQQRSRIPVNLATDDDHCHAVDVKSVNFQTIIDQSHSRIRLVRAPTVTEYALFVNESNGPIVG